MLKARGNAMRSIGLLLLVSAVAFGQRTAGAGTGGGRGGGFGGGNAYSHANTYGCITSAVLHAGHRSTLNTIPGSGMGGVAGGDCRHHRSIRYEPSGLAVYSVGRY